MTVLHIDSSILGDNSVSRELSAAAVQRLRDATPGLEVVRRDLVADPIPHLSGAYFAAVGKGAPYDPALAADIALGQQVMDEFLNADTVVIGVALYNFGIASQLKTWIDRILAAGKTFRYNEQGQAEGLATGKRVILTIARGGFYGAGTPHEGFEHTERYLRSVFTFIGIPDPEVIVAEGIATGPDRRSHAIDGAKAEIAALAA